MFGPLRRWREARLLARRPLADADWTAAVAAEPCLHGYTAEEHARLRRLATLIAATKDFVAADASHVASERIARIAALAAIPVLELDLDWYEGWHTVVLYPTTFRARHEVEDEAGVVHETVDDLGGEAWERGPVVLSWGDLEDGADRPGFNVVLHELAHKIDMCNGDANGHPPLHRGMPIEAWHGAFTSAYDDLVHRVETGAPTAIDDYAAESPAECFAVFTEAFFETPLAVREAYPRVYEQLAAFYRQDPAGRISARREEGMA